LKPAALNLFYDEFSLKAILQNLIGFFRWAISIMPKANSHPMNIPRISLKYNEIKKVPPGDSTEEHSY
jgi:hypothetical protein